MKDVDWGNRQEVIDYAFRLSKGSVPQSVIELTDSSGGISYALTHTHREDQTLLKLKKENVTARVIIRTHGPKEQETVYGKFHLTQTMKQILEPYAVAGVEEGTVIYYKDAKKLGYSENNFVTILHKGFADYLWSIGCR